MGICLNQNNIIRVNYDDISSRNNQIQKIIENKNEKDSNKEIIKKIEETKDGKNSKLKEKDTIQLSPIGINEKSMINNKDKIISYQIHSRYKSKFFNITSNKINNSMNNFAESNKNNFNNDNFDNLIHFSSFFDKKQNFSISTATNSNIK